LAEAFVVGGVGEVSEVGRNNHEVVADRRGAPSPGDLVPLRRLPPPEAPG
jgi:hypothetical protein